jgi:acyl carrier protein
MNTPAEVLMKLRQIAEVELNMTQDHVAMITPDSDLMEAMRLDSLATVVLISSVEREFGLVFEPEDWQSLSKVEDLVDLIVGGLATRGAAE